MAVSSLVLLVTQLLDGGAGLLMVRDVSREPDPARRRAAVRLGVDRRLRGSLMALPVTGVTAALILQLPPGALGVSAAYTAAAAWYGFVIQAHQAHRQFRRLMVLQVANGVIFVAGAAVILVLPESPSVAMMLAVPAASLAVLAVVGMLGVRQEIGSRAAQPEPSGRRELHAVQGGTVAVAATGNADQLLLGWTSASALASYAGAQRAALGIAALSTALMSYLLPTVSQDPASQRALLRRSRKLVVPAVVLAASLGAVLHWPLSSLYGDPDLADPGLLALLMAAYTLGAFSTAPVAVLYARDRGGAVSALNIAQALLVVTGCALSSWAASTAATAAVVALGRAGYLVGTTAVATRALRAVPERR